MLDIASASVYHVSLLSCWLCCWCHATCFASYIEWYHLSADTMQTLRPNSTPKRRFLRRYLQISRLVQTALHSTSLYRSWQVKVLSLQHCQMLQSSEVNAVTQHKYFTKSSKSFWHFNKSSAERLHYLDGHKQWQWAVSEQEHWSHGQSSGTNCLPSLCIKQMLAWRPLKQHLIDCKQAVWSWKRTGPHGPRSCDRDT